MDSDALFRMLYMRREHENVVSSINDLQGLIFVPDVVTTNGDDVWRGIVFIRLESSPWFTGSFPFTVVFPPKYPFHSPIATFDKPLRSHPLLKDDGTTIGFEAEFLGMEPMHVSVMMRLLLFIRRLFVPSEWIGVPPHMDLMACRRDVEMCSVTREVLLNKPYVQLLTEDVKDWFIRSREKKEQQQQQNGGSGSSGGSVATRPESFASWFTRTFVPSSRSLQ